MLDDVDAVFALHCDPNLEVGTVGLQRRADHLGRRPGRHPAQGPRRPHRPPAPHRRPRPRRRPSWSPTCPPGLAKLTDSRDAVNLTFGAIHAGDAAQRHPHRRPSCGARCGPRGRASWERRGPDRCEHLVAGHRRARSAPPGSWTTSVGAPPVVNDPWAVGRAGRAATAAVLGPEALRARPSRAAAARTSPGSSSGCPAPTPASACARPVRPGGRHPRRARSTSTSGPSPLGARLLAAPRSGRSATLAPPDAGHRDEHRRRSTTTCPTRPSRRSRSSRATPPGCWSTRGPDAPARAPHGRRPADAARPGRPAGGQRHPGASRPASTCARRPAARSRCCCSSAPAGARWEALVRPGRRVPPGTVLEPTGTPRASRWARTSATGAGAVERCSATSDRWPSSAARRGAAAAVHPPSRSSDPERYQTVFARRAGLGGGARRPACTSPTARARRAAATRVPRRRRSSWRSGSARSARSRADEVEDHPMHAERYARARRDVLRARATPPSGCVAVGTTSCAPSSRRPRPAARRAATDLFIHGDYRVPGGRPAAHQLPRAPVVAARAGRRVRRDRGGDGSTTRALDRGLPLPRPSATPCCSTAGGGGPREGSRSTSRPPTARRGPGTVDHAAGPFRDAVLHAGRHPGRGAGAVVGRPGATWASRSCSATRTT